MSDPRQTVRLLDWIRWVAIADALLLIPLVLNLAGVIDIESAIPALGSVHGIGFMALLFLCAKGAGEGRWGWWFPVAVVATLGPPGSLYGEWRLRRELTA